MNTIERRRLVRSNIIDASVARSAVNESRRQRGEAAERLRKELAARRYAVRTADAVSYPLQDAG